ncbi:dual 3',5'-cyclic-AMP and -GMP phosphodiesterase 11 [Caerostris extrusa]|uniref:Dual 3',5'-cyclic-AMP and -GMP phosphodiesterase 11 n=1 Tax=Caerostris extrusa TaxID=172846 RepID=A0AAV4SSE4_CAEEX|nr:dual 3',5'-cyclic-AMP and -GMP phosphodiesterase 11 [Caerostris extrusa]
MWPESFERENLIYTAENRMDAIVEANSLGREELCGICLRNVEFYEKSDLENKRYQVLLDLTRVVFEEQSTVDQIVHKVMIHIQSFLQVERCQVLLLDENTETLNIPDVLQDDRFDSSVDENSNFRHHSILCMPIRNASNNIVGVCQLINKLCGNPFTKNDEHIFEIFALFCGLGIQHTQIYEKSMKAIAKTKVILEVLSYHATASLEEVQELLRVGYEIFQLKMVEFKYFINKYHIPSTRMHNLWDLKFSYFSLNDKEMLKACLRMFMDLGFIQRFGLECDNIKLGHVLGGLSETLSLSHFLPAYAKV